MTIRTGLRSIQRQKFGLPQGRIIVNWASPLTRNLVHCCVGSILGVDIGYRAGTLNTIATAVNQGITPDGPGWGGLRTADGTAGVFSSSYSVFYRGIINSGGANNSFWGIIGTGVGHVLPQPAYFDLLGTPPNKIRAQANVADTQQTFTSTSTIAVAGQIFDCCFVNDLVAPNQILYINGVSEATGGFSTAPTLDGTGSLRAAGLVVHFMNVGYYWNRALSASEVLALHTNPYQLLTTTQLSKGDPILQVPAAGGVLGHGLTESILLDRMSLVA